MSAGAEREELRYGRRAPYSMVADWVALSDVSVGAKATYWLLVAHLNTDRGDGLTWPGQGVLAQLLRKSQGCVSKYVTELVELGAVESARGQGRNGTNLYLLHEVPPEEYQGYVSLTAYYDERRGRTPRAVQQPAERPDGQARQRPRPERPDPAAPAAETPAARPAPQPPTPALTSGYSPANIPSAGRPGPVDMPPGIDPHSPRNIHIFPEEYKLEEVNQTKETSSCASACAQPAPAPSPDSPPQPPASGGSRPSRCEPHNVTNCRACGISPRQQAARQAAAARAAVAAARPQWCGDDDCDPKTRMLLGLRENRGGPCPRCHPSRVTADQS